MSGTLRSASLRYVGLQQDTSIYELQSAQFANKYFILSGEGSRRLMASPEVVGFDSYLALLSETVDALRFLLPSGGDVDIMTRYNKLQFLVILLGTDQDGVTSAVDRIFRGYYKMNGSGSYSPSYTIEGE